MKAFPNGVWEREKTVRRGASMKAFPNGVWERETFFCDAKKANPTYFSGSQTLFGNPFKDAPRPATRSVAEGIPNRRLGTRKNLGGF